MDIRRLTLYLSLAVVVVGNNAMALSCRADRVNADEWFLVGDALDKFTTHFKR